MKNKQTRCKRNHSIKFFCFYIFKYIEKGQQPTAITLLKKKEVIQKILMLWISYYGSFHYRKEKTFRSVNRISILYTYLLSCNCGGQDLNLHMTQFMRLPSYQYSTPPFFIIYKSNDNYKLFFVYLMLLKYLLVLHLDFLDYIFYQLEKQNQKSLQFLYIGFFLYLFFV